MKKKKQFLSIVLMIFLSTLCISCKKGLYAEEHKFLYNKMSEITVEDDKYYLDYDEENGITYRKNIEKEQVLQGEKLTIDTRYIQENEETVFNIKYRDYDFLLSIEFMENRSEPYVKINDIWKEKLEDYNGKSKIVQIYVFDERLFIVTCNMNTHLAGNVKGETPYCLYYYDFDADDITYCGFFAGTYDSEYGSYSGFSEAQELSIFIK